jgi:hypothetical protein
MNPILLWGFDTYNIITITPERRKFEVKYALDSF